MRVSTPAEVRSRIGTEVGVSDWVAVTQDMIDRFADLTGELSDEVKQKILGVIPLGRFGSVNDIAAMVDYLASEEGGYVTGQVFSIDGGMAI